MPGEKLARVVTAPGAEGLEDEEPTTLETGTDTEAEGDVALEGSAEGDEAGRRRRRRRGGRGRGRGRGRDGEALPMAEAGGPIEAGSDADAGNADEDDEDEDVEIVASAANPARRAPRPTPFGSVWDSQLGVPSRQAPAAVGPVADDEDFDEPEIPEYLIAEQRRGNQQQGGRGGPGARGGARGGRSAYTAAIERERYGRGGGGGINRYPDVSGRDRDRPRPPERQPSRGSGRPDTGPGRQERFDRPAPRSGDPWSEVPPELEEMLRAQLAQSPKGRRPQPEAAAVTSAPAETSAEVGPKRRPARRKAEATVSEPTADAATVGGPAVETVAPRRRTATRRKAENAGNDGAPQAEAAADAAPKRRTSTRKKAEAGEPAPGASGDEAGPSAAKRRTTRKKAEPA
jgi:ribonuclease E